MFGRASGSRSSNRAMTPLLILLLGLCQTQYDPKDQESKVHTLCRVDDDAHPGTAEAPARKCVQEDTANDRRQDAPGLVGVVGAMEHTVCYPAPPAKYSLHFGKQHPPK